MAKKPREHPLAPVSHIANGGCGLFVHVDDSATVGQARQLVEIIGQTMAEHHPRDHQYRPAHLSDVTNGQLTILVMTENGDLDPVRATLTKLLQPKYTNIGMPSAKVIRNKWGKHLGTVALIVAQCNIPDEVADRVRRIKGVDRALVSNNKLRFSVSDPSNVEKIVRAVAKAIGLTFNCSFHLNDEEPQFNLIAACDYQPAAA